MSARNFLEKSVLDYMVREPMVLDELQPVAKARQLMLMHSFSNIPVFTNGAWHLLSDIALSKYLANSEVVKKLLLGRSIQEAFKLGEGQLQLKQANVKGRDTKIGDLINSDAESASLWVIAEGSMIFGIITPFELM